MRLIYADPHPVPDSSPEALQILQTCDGLAQAGVEVELVTPQATSPVESVLGRLAAPGLRFHPLARPRSSMFRRSNRWFYDQCADLLASLRGDAVLVRNLKLADGLLRTGMDLPLFFETHEVFAQTFRETYPKPGLKERWKLRQLVARETRVYRGCTGLIGLTQLLLDDVDTAYGPIARKLVAPDGVDLEQAAAARQPRPATPLPTALYLGSLHAWKGVETLLHALTEVHNVLLWIAGGTDKRISALKALALRLGVAERTNFLGFVPPQDRFRIINQADICLLPLHDASIGARYTSPLKLFEYMAMGKAIIASDLPSIREVLSDRHNAVLVPAGDARAWATAMTDLASAGPRRAALGAEALDASQRFGWAARGQSMAKFIFHTRSISCP